MNNVTPNEHGPTPHWLKWVYSKYGTSVELKQAELLYRGSMSGEEHNALCVAGNLTALLAHLEIEDHPLEREVFFISSFYMTYRNHPEVAIEIARRFIDECFRDPSPFLPNTKPDNKLLKQLALLYEYECEFDWAVWACRVALSFGITDDGTQNGFPGRIVKLQKLKEKNAVDTEAATDETDPSTSSG